MPALRKLWDLFELGVSPCTPFVLTSVCVKTFVGWHREELPGSAGRAQAAEQGPPHTLFKSETKQRSTPHQEESAYKSP
jgi:hypothetical protein